MAVKKITIGKIELVEGRNYSVHLDPKTNDLVIEQECPEPEWLDVTTECKVVTKLSRHGGIYNRLMHKGNVIACFSPIKSPPELRTSLYKFEVPPNGTFSCKIFKKNPNYQS
jgi:hypothetical protein